MIISQNYLTTASGTIQNISNAAELDKKDATRYYYINSFQALSSNGALYADVRASGKHNQYLDIHFYFACPLVEDSLVSQSGPFKYWYGVSFKKQISNRLSMGQK